VHPALRRVQQFYQAVFARVRADEYELIRERLSPAQAALFMRMMRSDQRHCLDVYYTLIQAGYQEDDLLRAALLHDAGKSLPADRDSPAGKSMPAAKSAPAGEAVTDFRALAGSAPVRVGQRMTVFHRVAIVLMQAFPGIGPRWLARLAVDGRGWKAPFAVHVRHAQVSAEWAAAAGCSPAVVNLIRVHHGRSECPREAKDLAAALQWADEQH
jgi:hypothetical protein